MSVRPCGSSGRVPSSPDGPGGENSEDWAGNKHRDGQDSNRSILSEHFRDRCFIASVDAREDDNVHRDDGTDDSAGDPTGQEVDQPSPEASSFLHRRTVPRDLPESETRDHQPSEVPASRPGRTGP